MDILINIDVARLDEAIAFYENAIGLRLSRRLFDGSVAEMLGASSPIYLLTKEAGSCAISHAASAHRRDYARHWTPVHVDFIVGDINAAVSRATQSGANIEGQSQTFAWGHLATLSDPFGNGLCFVQWTGAGYGETAETTAGQKAAGLDEDLDGMTPGQLLAEVKRLRQGVRAHRDSSGHALCWHHPALWGLLPDKTDPQPVVPEWPQFLQGCIQYRQSLDAQAPEAPRSDQPYQE